MAAGREEKKRCKDCGMIKPVSDFYANRRVSPGRVHYSSACRFCISARNKRVRRQGEPSKSSDTKRHRRITAEDKKGPRTTKTCTCCGRTKDSNDFPVRRTKDGTLRRNQPCKLCVSAKYHAAQMKVHEGRQAASNKGRRVVTESSPLPPKVCASQPYEGVVISDIAGKNLRFPDFKGYGFGD